MAVSFHILIKSLFVWTDPYIDAGNGSGWFGEDIFQKPERGSAFKTAHFQAMNIRLPFKRAKYVIPSGGIFADPVFGKTIFKGRGRHHMFAPRLNLWITPKCRKATQRSTQITKVITRILRVRDSVFHAIREPPIRARATPLY